MLSFLSTLTAADWVKIVVFLTPVLTLGLNYLSKQKVIASSAGRTKIVQSVGEILAQLESDLESPPAGGWTTSALFSAGIGELKSLYTKEIALQGWPKAAVDQELTLLFQRYAAKLPAWTQALGTEFFSSSGAPSTPGGTSVMSVRRRAPRFVRSVGPIA